MRVQNWALESTDEVNLVVRRSSTIDEAEARAKLVNILGLKAVVCINISLSRAITRNMLNV